LGIISDGKSSGLHVIWPLWVLCVPLLVYCCFAASCQAANAGSDAKKEDIAATLFERSWNSPSPAEKAMLRRRIVGMAPASAYGRMSAAWLADRDQRPQEALRYYRECMESAPDFVPCKYNLAISADEREATGLLQQICAQTPDFTDYGCFKKRVALLAKTSDEEGARALFAEAQQNASAGVEAYLRAYWLRNVGKDAAGAMALLDKSLSNGTYDLDAIALWMDVGGLCRKFPRWPRSGCAPGIALCR
jgi:hypothetical protein